MTIFPSDCTARAFTLKFGPVPGLKEGSMEPSAFRRAMLLRAVPLMLVKEPPSTIFPSDCTMRACTWPNVPLACGLGLKEVSSEPSVFRRATPSRAVPLTLVKEPKTMVFPSDCLARPPEKPIGSKTLALKPGSTSPPAAGKIDAGSCESANDCAVANRLRHISIANKNPARINSTSILVRNLADWRSEQPVVNIAFSLFVEPWPRHLRLMRRQRFYSIFTQAIDCGELPQTFVRGSVSFGLSLARGEPGPNRPVAW